LIKDFAKGPRIEVANLRVDSGNPKFQWLKKVLVLVALIVILTFLFIPITGKFIVEVKGSFIDQTDTSVVEAPIQGVKPKLKPKVIEQASATDFTYGTMLKQAEVNPAYVPAYESTPKDPTKKTSHVLQVVSFKSEVDAKALEKRLVKKKLTNVQVTQSKAKLGSIWYTVMVGPFQNRSMLNKAQDILAQMNFSPLERESQGVSIPE